MASQFNLAPTSRPEQGPLDEDLRSLIEAMPQMAFIASPSGAITYFNRRWYEFIGQMRDTEGWGWARLPVHHPDDLEPTVASWNHSIKTGEDYQIEYRLRRHDGIYRWHLGRAVAVRDSHGRIKRWVGTNTDIHEQKQVHQRLEEERDLRERFVSMLTHDLRTPLTAAKISAQLLARKAADVEAVLRGATRIAHSMDRADHMIRDMLDASRIGAGQSLALDFQTTDLERTVRDAVDELRTIHGDRVVLQTDGSVIGRWSPHDISRILENLIGNAVKYGAPQRPIIVKLRSDLETGSVLIEVHNEGAPIPPGELESLFEPFRRAQSAVAGHQRGWGLGLTLVRGLAEAHGGNAGVQSSSEAGTTFWVRLPRSDSR